MIGRIFYFFSALLVLIGSFILLSPSLITPDLIYPNRIDSTYIAYHSFQEGANPDTLLFNPTDVGLKYSELKVITTDGLTLKGWITFVEDTPANTIIIFHDLNESRILYIDHLKQFHDRGFNVAIFDMRAHGSSEGLEFTPGLPSLDDAVLMIDSIIAKNGTRHIVLMGVGIGSAVALQAAVYDTRTDGLILQSPFSSYEDYLDRYATLKWGLMKDIWFPVLLKRSTELLKYPIEELDLAEIAKYTSVPSLFIIGSEEEKVFTSEALQVFDASVTEKKELFLVRNAARENIAKAGGEAYYNRITAFFLSTLPKVQKTTRFKKLAINDN